MVEFFGTTIRETLDALSSGPVLGSPGSDDRQKAIMRIVISFVILAIGVYFVVYDSPTPIPGEANQIIIVPSEMRSYGASIIGLVIGYWLK